MEAAPLTSSPPPPRVPPGADAPGGASPRLVARQERSARDPELEAALREEPTSFEFFEAVRQIERLRPGATTLGRSLDPAGEPLRFSVQPSIAFPPSEIRTLDLDGDGPARMSVNFLGLTGPVGVLPHSYSLLVMERVAARDTGLRDFFDLFHHRLLSLFYRAWEKHRFAVAYERGEDRLREHLLDLLGLGGEAQQRALTLPADMLAYYGGLLVGESRSAAALQQLLADFFDVRVEIEQFVGDWYPVSRTDQCELGDEDADSSALGVGSLVGDEVWDRQCKVRVRIGPLSRARYQEFLPGGGAHQPLHELLRFYSRDQFDFELQLVLAREDVPTLVLGGDAAPQPLGWSTWLRSAPFARDPDDTVLAL